MSEREQVFRQQLVALLPRLRRFALGLTSSTDGADDLVQASCQRAMEKWRQWQGAGRLDGWVFRIAHNLWQDEVRRQGLDRREAGLDPDHVASTTEVRRIADRLELDEVRRMISELPEDQRAVLLLVCVEGLTYREAAEVLVVRVGTVISRLSRARATLSERLGRPAAALPKALGVNR